MPDNQAEIFEESNDMSLSAFLKEEDDSFDQFALWVGVFSTVMILALVLSCMALICRQKEREDAIEEFTSDKKPEENTQLSARQS